MVPRTLLKGSELYGKQYSHSVLVAKELASVRGVQSTLSMT